MLSETVLDNAHRGPSAGDAGPGPIDANDLFLRYFSPVFSHVSSRLQDPTEAEDVTAEIFAAAATALPRYRGEAAPYGWLLGIARKKIADAVHRRKLSRQREISEADLPRAQQETLGLLLMASARQLPEDALLRKEARMVMRQLLDRLPEPQREALLLQVSEDLSLKEIGRIVGRSEEAVSSLIRRARAAIFRYGQDYFKVDRSGG